MTTISFPALFATVVQITNGFFFADRPFEFTRPIHPEASGILAGKASSKDYATKMPKDAVSYTFGLGSAFSKSPHVEYMAFTNGLMRHENLLWLAEVAGERSAVWHTALSHYGHIDWIDADLAAANVDYLVQKENRNAAVRTYHIAGTSLKKMCSESPAYSNVAASVAADMRTCQNQMGIVKDLAADYTYAAGYFANETNLHVRQSAAADLSLVRDVAVGVSNLVAAARSISTVIHVYATFYEVPAITAQMDSFVQNGDSANSLLASSANLISAAIDSCDNASPFLVNSTNAADRSIAISYATNAETAFGEAAVRLAGCAEMLGEMASSAFYVYSEIYQKAFGTERYIRTPAYFSDHRSTADLLEVANASTNFFTDVAVLERALDAPFPPDDYREKSAMEILQEEFNYVKVKESIAATPSYGSVFSNGCFKSAAVNLSGVEKGSVLIPIEEFAKMSYEDGSLVVVNATEEHQTCEPVFWRGYVTGSYTPPTNTFLTAQRFSLPPTDPAFNPNEFIVFTAYAYPGAPYVDGHYEPFNSYTNEVTEIRKCTPQAPVTYRDCPYHVHVREDRWSAWGWTEKLGYFLGLQDEQGKNFLIYTNKTTVIQEQSPDQRPFSFNFAAFSPMEALTNGPPLDVKTICAQPYQAIDFETGESYFCLYFRTNSYQLGICRAFGTDGMIKKRTEDDAVSFVSLVVDVEYEFSLYFLGWKDHLPDGGDTHIYIPATSQRMLMEIEAPFDDSYRLKSTNIIAAVRTRLENHIISTYDAEFDMGNALRPPPYELSGPGLWATKFTATRDYSLSFTIKDIFVTGGVEFSQGVTNAPSYHVPGYRHLSFPGFPGTGWVGPFDMRPGKGGEEALLHFRASYQELIHAQSSRVPISAIYDLYLYELKMKSYFPFMWDPSSLHPMHMDLVPSSAWPPFIDDMQSPATP